jgi:uncharacterized protein (DUF302 family)
METTRYGLKVTSSLPVDEAVEQVREALAEEGFGVLTEIDLAATLAAKIGLELAPYRILGACRPPLAAAAVQSEPDIGLLLPCNVVVYATGDHTVVAALDPGTMVELTGNQGMADVAGDARGRLERALAVVADAA